jgi:hypothetical protein
MTNFDDTDLANEPSDGAMLLKRAIIGIAGTIGLLFIAGMIAGYASVAIAHGGPGLIDAAILSAMVALAALVAFAIWRWWPRGIEAPRSPRVRSARNILIAAFVIALALGVIIGFAGSGTGAFLTNGPVSGTIALLAIAIWAVTFLLTWLWWRTIDEHEAGAYRDGALVAAHAYLFITPAWWMASRAGWLPAQEPILVLFVVSLVWSIVWFVRRYF